MEKYGVHEKLSCLMACCRSDRYLHFTAEVLLSIKEIMNNFLTQFSNVGTK